jgi:hypothetical protein
MTAEQQQLDLNIVARLVGYIDGWSLYEPDMLKRLGLPDAFMDEITQEFTSDHSSPKSIITNQQGVVADGGTVRGVSGLTLGHALCDALDLDGSNSFSGRGFEARHLRGVITAHLVRNGIEVQGDKG